MPEFSAILNNRAHFQAIAGGRDRAATRRVNLAHLPAPAVEIAAGLSSIALCTAWPDRPRDTGCTAAGRLDLPVTLAPIAAALDCAAAAIEAGGRSPVPAAGRGHRLPAAVEVLNEAGRNEPQ